MNKDPTVSCLHEGDSNIKRQVKSKTFRKVTTLNAKTSGQGVLPGLKGRLIILESEEDMYK
jgi:hypothetical protein